MSQQPANNQNLLSASELKPNSSVPDVACEPGTLALRLAHHAGQVHGIDFSESMPAVFRNQIEQAGHRNIEIRSVTQAFPVCTTAEFRDYLRVQLIS